MIGIGKETVPRTSRVRFWFARHWRWLRGRGSRDGRTVYVRTIAIREPEIGALRRTDDGVLEMLVSTGSFGEIWEPAASRYVRYRVLDMDAGLTLHEELERAGWTPPTP